ncbi:unnamed protein product [Pylaiella littoralis]
MWNSGDVCGVWVYGGAPAWATPLYAHSLMMKILSQPSFLLRPLTKLSAPNKPGGAGDKNHLHEAERPPLAAADGAFGRRIRRARNSRAAGAGAARRTVGRGRWR